MKIHRPEWRRILPALILLSLAALAPTARPPAAADTLDLQAPVPVDTLVRIGKLDNGLTYYIRRNPWPEKRASLRLAVNAGSVLEDDDQRGLAHFVEHMNFNGSAHFKPGQLIHYLETIGSRFGADTNASTDYDETVYILEIPTDRDTLIDRGILAMSDYAGRATMSDPEVEKERGVVLEEWRLRQGAANRLRMKQDPVLYHGSRYADRPPIGLPEIIKGAPPQRIRDFYSKWYRPENMAFVVVGDVDPDQVERLIRAHFSDLSASPTPTAVPVFDIPPHSDTRVLAVTDPEATSSGFSVYYKHPREREETLADYRRDLVEGLAFTMLSDRLDEVSRRDKAPFLGAFARNGPLVRSAAAVRLAGSTVDGGVETGLKAALAEIRRAEKFGFGAAELDRARLNVRASLEKAWSERDRTESRSLVGEYVSNFLDHEPIPGIDWEYRTTRALLPDVTLEDVNDVLPGLITTENRVALAWSPEKSGVKPPSEAALRAVLAAADTTTVAPWVDVLSGSQLLARKPRPGKVVKTRTLPAIGVTVLTLSNGAEVWLKPTDFKRDQILFTSYAPGGASTVDSTRYFEAVRAPSIVMESGVGGFRPYELDKLLAGKIVQGAPYVGNYLLGAGGSSAPADLETALQYLYLTFTTVTDRPEVMGVLKSRWMEEAKNRGQSPEVQFSDRVSAVNTGGSYMARAMRPADVDSLRLDRSLEFYRKSFSNAADFTFFFVGSFTVDGITPLLERYVASLPSTGRRTPRVLRQSFVFPDSVVRSVVAAGTEPKSRTTITFFADTGLDEMQMFWARSAATVLRLHLRDILREELGATYSIDVAYSSTQPVKGFGTLSVNFGSSPENAPRMVATVLDEVRKLQTAGPSADDLQRTEEMARRELENAEKRNDYWLGSLQSVHMLGWDPDRIVKRRERIDLLTADGLKAAFVRYFPLNRYSVVSLMPASSGGEGAR